jgi:hypothetical protein
MCILHFPIRIAPAALKRSTTSASPVGILAARVLLPAVVRTPAVSILSFRPIGIPCRGLRKRPAACSFSSALACAKALSRITVIQALILGL